MMKVISNDLSARANPRRGYHDYEMVIEYEDAPEWKDERYREGIRDGLVAYLRYSKRYMWAGVREQSPRRLVIGYGYDSGD